MKSSEVFTINGKIDIAVDWEGIFCTGVIQEITGEYVAVYIPPAEDGRPRLTPGDYVRGRVCFDDAQYQFNSTVLGVKQEEIPLYLLAVPSSLKRVQLREYVRVKSQIFPVWHEVVAEGTKAGEIPDPCQEGYSVDVSGGGMRLVVSTPVAVGNLLAIKFAIGDRKKEKRTINATARVKRKETPKKWQGRCIVGVSFEEIAERDRDLIIGFLFRRILEQRRSGVDGKDGR